MIREIKFRAWNPENEQMIYNISLKSLSRLREEGEITPLRLSMIYDFDKLIWLKYTGIKDKNSKEVYIDDLLKDEKGKVFRVYDFPGGPVIKAYSWAENINELSVSDQLIVEPLADTQTQSYIKQSCEVIGNIYQTPNRGNKIRYGRE